MEKYQFVVIKFKYTDNFVCLWPVCFDFDLNKNFGYREKETLDNALTDLKNYPGIKEVQIIFNKIVNMEECVDTIDSILKTLPNDDSVAIKYLELEKQIELIDHPKFDYETNSYYIPIQLARTKFPVRVRAINFKFLLDDFELPILLVKEQE